MVIISSIILIICLIATHSQKREPFICDDYSECDQVGRIDNPKIECSAGKSCESTQITSTGVQGYVKCSGRESCTNTMGTGIQVEESLFCSGYKSCKYAPALQAEVAKCAALESCAHVAQITSNTLIYCGGQASCYNSGLIPGTKAICEGFESCKQSTITSGDGVQCSGDKSCSEATITSPGTVMCTGRYSCQDTMIRADVSVHLFGAFAAKGATIRDTPLIEGYGDTVLKNSIIDSGSLVFVTVKLYGFTLYKEENPNVFICRAGAECNLYCIGAGCKGLEFRCLPGSTCNIHPSACEVNPDQAIDGVICPPLTDGTTPPKIDDDQEERMIFEADNVKGEKEYISEEGGIMTDANVECNLAQECVGQTIGLRTDIHPIIQCGGFESCDAAKLTLRYLNFTGLSEIQCQGENACTSGDMIATNGRVLCDGESSCNSATRIRAQGIACYGKESCHQATMGVIAGGSLPYIECRGTISCQSAQIMNRFGTTYCTGNSGCNGASISSQFDVQCLGYNACSAANVTTNGGVICNGNIACNAMTVNFTEDVDHFVANGYLAAHQATIYGSLYGTNILGMGYKSLAYSTIDSDASTLIKVNLYGHLAGYFATYICRSGSECHLTCRGEACKRLDYQCEAGATCFIEPADCNSSKSVAGVICPNFNTNAIPKDIDQLLERKQAFRDEDTLWIDEEVLLVGNIQIDDVKTVSQGGLVLGIVGVVFIMSLVYLCWKLKVKANGEYKAILK